MSRVSLYLVLRTYRNYYNVQPGDYIIKMPCGLCYKVETMDNIDESSLKLTVSNKSPALLMTNIKSTYIRNQSVDIEINGDITEVKASA